MWSTSRLQRLNRPSSQSIDQRATCLREGMNSCQIAESLVNADYSSNVTLCQANCPALFTAQPEQGKRCSG